MANLKSEKKLWMNALRQTKEYYKPSPGFIKAQEEAKDHLEKCHQKLWGESYYNDPSEHDGDVYPEDRKDKRNAYHKQHVERDYIEEAKIEIIDKITKHFDDVIFEMVCEEMSKRYVFQSQNYLTEAGFEVFEEQFFEFYHEHHGEILHEVMKNIAND